VKTGQGQVHSGGVDLRSTQLGEDTPGPVHSGGVDLRVHPSLVKTGQCQVHSGGVDLRVDPTSRWSWSKGFRHRYCDDHHLTPRQRLELFVPVCHAIQHAHQKGIIHRDIKPSNVLVAEYDDRGAEDHRLRVAKAIQQPLTERTMFTHFGQVVARSTT